MKINIISKPEKIYQSQCKFYRQIKDCRKSILLMTNQYEYLDLSFTQEFFLRKKIKTYDYDEDTHDTEQEILKKIFPIIKGFKPNYLGNKFIGFLGNENHFPFNQDIGFIKLIGPGEITGTTLIAPENIEFFFKSKQDCTTFSWYHYLSYYSSEKFEQTIIKYPHQLLITNKIEEIKVAQKDSIIITPVSLFKNDFKYNELYSLPFRIFYILMGLKNLKKGGDLYLVYQPIRFKSNYQVLYLLSTLFQDYNFIESKFGFKQWSFYKFINFNGQCSSFRNLYQQLYSHDPNLGEKSILNNNLKDNLIFDLGDLALDQEFVSFLNQYNQQHINKITKFLNKYDYIYKLILRKPSKIDDILNENLDTSINIAKKNKLELKEYFINFFKKKSSFKKIKKDIFPNILDVNFNKLQINFEGTYSITLPPEGNKISSLIRKRYPQAKTIADMTANVGGNSINFCHNFDFVHSIEINQDNFKILENNLSCYGFQNYQLYHQDCLNFKKKADCYFYDPPWTGILYKMSTNMNLFLGNKNIVNVIYPNFCLKVPLNYNLKGLLQKFPSLQVHNLKYYLVILNNSQHKSKTNKSRKKLKKKKKTTLKKVNY